jgi:flagellar hook-associated protein 1 FlgK
LLTELAEKIDISVVYSDDSSMSIFIGNGQSVLNGVTVSTLAVEPSPNDPALDVIVYNGPFGSFDLSAQLQGGELGGLLSFKSTILTPAINSLGRTAIAVAETVNTQMRAGMDLNGNLGQDFFSYNDAKIFNATTNLGTATVTSDVTDVSALTINDYGLAYDGTNWTITSDKGTTATVANGAPATLTFEGITLTIDGTTAAAGDRFTIKPTLGGAESINVVLTDPRLIAAAAPIRTSSSLSNLGTVKMSAGTVTDSTALGTIPDVNFTFTSATSFTSNATVVTGGISYASGAVIPYTNNMEIDANGWQVSLTGVPAATDQFEVQSNAGGTGDNRNLLKIANLQNQLILDGGSASFQDDYATFVGFVGLQTQAANVSRDAHSLLLDQSVSRNASVVGVNLDEEAADLIRFQQAYQAAAQVISTVQTLFDTLLQSTR